MWNQSFTFYFLRLTGFVWYCTSMSPPLLSLSRLLALSADRFSPSFATNRSLLSHFHLIIFTHNQGVFSISRITVSATYPPASWQNFVSASSKTYILDMTPEPQSVSSSLSSSLNKHLNTAFIFTRLKEYICMCRVLTEKSRYYLDAKIHLFYCQWFTFL